jgi:hypothetical protein
MATLGPISANTTLSATSNARSSSALSTDQKSSIQSVLGEFDSKNLSAADAKKITSEFRKLGVQPGRELAETMAASGFDAKQVGGLAFGQGQSASGGASGGSSRAMVSSSLSELKSLMASIGVSSTDSGKSDEEVSQATDAFLKTVFSQSADSRTASTTNQRPQGGPPPGGPQGGNPPPPSPASNKYQDSSDIENYLASLISSITSGSNTTTSGISASAGTSKVVQSASSLLKASGIGASSENLQSFMQLLQKNMTASMEDKGNLVDHSV